MHTPMMSGLTALEIMMAPILLQRKEEYCCFNPQKDKAQ